MLGQLISRLALFRVCYAAHAVVQLPLSVAAAIGASADIAPHGAVMMWPLCHIRAGDELTRDALPGQRSLQPGAALLTLLSNPRQGSVYPILEADGVSSRTLDIALPSSRMAWLHPYVIL